MYPISYAGLLLLYYTGKAAGKTYPAHKFKFNIKINQLHAVSRTQQGRQREPSVKTLRSPLFAEFWRHCVLSGRTQRRKLYINSKFNIHTSNISFVICFKINLCFKVQTRLHKGPISPSYSHLNCLILSRKGSLNR